MPAANRSKSLLLAVSTIAAALLLWIPAHALRQSPGAQNAPPPPIKASEFSRLVRELSEPSGYFQSDNFTSNETAYLTVLGKMRELHISGGAYIGVGPEQNFTYIAKIRPRIAFIVDIRRQAVLQHLLYKALFHMSETRAEFVAGLLSRPLSGKSAPGKDSSGAELMDYFTGIPASEEMQKSHLSKIRRIIQQDFEFPLSESDQRQLEYVHSAFAKEGTQISFRMESGSSYYRRFPSFKDLVLEKDLNGELENFLAREEDYRFVRSLQELNRVIPVVGDFAGPKALAGVGDYLKKNGYVVRAFYTSNVEQFLFQNDIFAAFTANIRKLPIDETSVFIRSVSSMGQGHPAHVAGHRNTTVLQKISVFLNDSEAGAHTSYWNLVTTHFIAAQ